MELEWWILGHVIAAEAIMFLLLILPGLDRLRKGLVEVTRATLKPLFAVVPYCIFLLVEIYWRCETRRLCDHEHACTAAEYLQHRRSIIENQRNAVLIATALFLYFLLFLVTNLVVWLEQLNQGIHEKLNNHE